MEEIRAANPVNNADVLVHLSEKRRVLFCRQPVVPSFTVIGSSSPEKLHQVTQRPTRSQLSSLIQFPVSVRQGILIRSRDARTFLAQGEYEHIDISFSNFELFSCSFESKLCTLPSRLCSLA